MSAPTSRNAMGTTRMNRRQAVTALGVLAAGCGWATTSSAQQTSSLAQAVQAHYQQVKDFTASFEQTYVGGVLKRRTTERGTVAIRKPGRMRWDYTTPEKKLFIADGTRMYFYVPADRQVRVSPMPASGRVPTPILFLAGQGDLTRDFKVSEVDAPSGLAGTRALKLTPVRPEPEYESLTLVVDGQTYAIRRLEVLDGQGGTSTFTFSDLRENVGVSERQFQFTIPKGVDVVQQ